MRRVIFFTPILLLFLLFPVTTFAEDFVIDSYHSDITIQSSGVVKIKESINANFSSNEKHGIYRDIPYAYSSNDGTLYTEVVVDSVLRNNQDEKYDISQNESNLRIRIGDGSKTVSGKQAYVINYSVKGVLSSYNNFPNDELYWNVTGNEWGTSIAQATARVILEKPGLVSATCYFGAKGAESKCSGEIKSSSISEFSSGPLNAFEGMTVVASYKKGLFPILKAAAPDKYPFLKLKYLYVFLGTVLLGVLLTFYYWYKNGRDVWSSTPLSLAEGIVGKSKPIGTKDIISVEFVSPERLRPAEIGVLIDERVDTLDVTATIVDLAVRGFINIRELEKSWIFGKSDYELTKNEKDISGLLPYEKTLVSNLFTSGNKVKLSELKMTFYDELKEVKEKLYKTVVTKGFFVENPEKRRNNFLIVAIVLSSISFFLMINLMKHYYLISFFGGILFSSVFLLLVSRSMARRSVIGSDLYRRALGYKLFISGAEKYRQQFFEKKNMFNEILPYAIVFGLTEKFAKAMAEMGVETSSPSWYTGVHTFSYMAFATDVNSFSSSLSSAISSAPSSSGTSGGSSGGGFGGGGGGSW